MKYLIILLFFLPSCLTLKSYEKVNYKQSHSQPHQFYKDKPTYKRTFLVKGHRSYRSY